MLAGEIPQISVGSVVHCPSRLDKTVGLERFMVK